MSKETTISEGSFVQGLFQVGLYKRTQGRIARQVTFVAMLAVFLIAAWRLYATIAGTPNGGWLYASLPAAVVDVLRHVPMMYVVPGIVAAVGLWLSYRTVNVPRFADFLIAVEAEMNKVTWPTRTHLIRNSAVVIVVMLVLAVVLYVFDMAWITIFKSINILK
jgi:preprotein translocase subunit SecE